MCRATHIALHTVIVSIQQLPFLLPYTKDAYFIVANFRHMVLTRFPTLTGLVSTPPVVHPCFSLASSASCDAFTEQQTSFMEPGPCNTQARSNLGKNKPLVHSTICSV